MVITQIEYKNLSNEIRNQIPDNETFYYYKLSDRIDSYFIAYDNIFHSNNKYLFPINETFSNIKESHTNAIKKYLNKPLQVMVESNKLDLINNLKKLSFILKRETYERTFTREELISNEYEQVSIKLFNRDDKEFKMITKNAYDYYLETHKNINPFTGTFDDFIELVPDKVICQIENKKINNLIFVDENELCYITCNDVNSFIDFSLTVANKMFNKFKSIMIEADSTDKFAMTLKMLFKENSSEIYKTFIYG